MTPTRKNCAHQTINNIKNEQPKLMIKVWSVFNKKTAKNIVDDR